MTGEPFATAMVTCLRLDGWRSGIRFDAAHFIPGHPKCGRMHGHTYAISCVVHGEPAANGFILDFGEVKAALRAVADRLDHKVLVATRSKEFSVDDAKGEVAFVVGGKRYALPRGDVELLAVEGTTAEALSAWVAEELFRVVDVPPNVTHVEIGLDEGYGKGAWTTKKRSP